MSALVADTHAILWYLLKSPRMSAHASERMSAAILGGHPLYVSSISLVEIIYLVEKGRIPDHARRLILDHVDAPNSGIRIVPLDRSIIEAISRISRDQVPDMPDRIIAATAHYLGFPLVSRDRRIRIAEIETIW